MGCSQPYAWCHGMKLKMRGCEQVTVLLAVYNQVCTFHDGCKQGIDQQIFNRKSISCKFTHPQS